MGGPGSGIKDRDARNMTKMRGGGKRKGRIKEARREVRSKYLFRSVIQHTRDLWSKPEI